MSMVGMMGILGTGQLCVPIVILVMAVLFKYFLASRRPNDFPPGPPTVPFLGNITQVPRTKAFLKYATNIQPGSSRALCP